MMNQLLIHSVSKREGKKKEEKRKRNKNNILILSLYHIIMGSSLGPTGSGHLDGGRRR